jgi:hypothetical protein
MVTCPNIERKIKDYLASGEENDGPKARNYSYQER